MNWQAVSELNAEKGKKTNPKFPYKGKQMTLWKKNACAMEMIASKNSILIEKSTQTVDKHAPKRRIN